MTPNPTPEPTTTEAPSDLVTFTYHVRQTADGATGGCKVTAGTAEAPVTISCTDVTRFRRHGHRVTFSGHASVDGATTTYKIDVADLAHPGTGHDVFRIRTGTGFDGGGELDSGDLTVD